MCEEKKVTGYSAVRYITTGTRQTMGKDITVIFGKQKV